MEDKLDKLVQMLQDSETRMSREMQAIKSAVDDIKPEISSLQGAVSTLKPEIDSIKATFEAWRPDMESKVGDLNTAVSDLRHQVSHIAKGCGAGALGTPPSAAPSAAPSPSLTQTRCSMEGPSRATAESKSAFISAAEDRIIDGEVISYAVSLPATCSSVCPSSDASALVSALIPSTKCSTKCFDIGVVDWYMEVAPEADQIDVFSRANINCLDPGEDRRPPWPPPPRVLEYMWSEELLQHDKIQRQPWPPPLKVRHQGQTFRPRPWPAFRCSLGDVQFTLSRLSGCWHSVTKVLQSSGNPSTLKATMYVWKSRQGIFCTKTSTHMCTQESYAEYNLVSVRVETVKEHNSLHQSWFQLYTTSNALLYGSTNVQLKIAWFSTCHANVMKLQGFSWECSSSMGVHLTRGSVCRTILCVEGNKFRNLTHSGSGAYSLSWSDRGVLIQLSGCALKQWSPLVLMVYTYWLLKEQVYMGAEVLDMQLLGWFDSAVLSGCNTFVYVCVFNMFQKLVLYQYLLNRAVAIHLMVNSMVLSASDAANIRCSGAEFQCIIIGRPNYLTRSNQCQEETYSKVKQLLYPVFKATIPDAFHCGGEKHAREQLFMKKLGGVPFIPSFLHGKGLARYLCSLCACSPALMMPILFEAWFTCVLPMCIGMRREKLKGSGELNQWLASILLGECFPSNVYGSDISSMNRPSQTIMAGFQVGTALVFWAPVDLNGKTNQNWRILWDPGGCIFALCSCENWWASSELTPLHYSDQLLWLSLLLTYASRIWWVAWAETVLEFSAGYGQAQSQGGMNFTNQTIFSDQVHVGHNFYTAFVNKISIGYDCYLNQVHYFDTFGSDLIYFREDYHDDLDKIKEVHTPWDPGKSALRYPSKTLAWGQADFQEGRNVMTLACVSPAGPLSQAIGDGLSPTDLPSANAATYMHREARKRLSGWITELNGGSLLSPVFPSSPTSGSSSLIPTPLLLLVSPN